MPAEKETILGRLALERGYLTPSQLDEALAAQRAAAEASGVTMPLSQVLVGKNLLTPDQVSRISGDGTPENPGIDANNRLIWGQVFLWPEADGDWRILWDDSQVFETREAYARFKEAWNAFHAVHMETAFRG